MSNNKEVERAELHRDHLADRQRSAWSCRRLGFQELRARYAVLPIYFRELDLLPE